MLGRNFTICIIDDEERIRNRIIKIIEIFIEKINFNKEKIDFKLFENANSATEYFQENKKADVITLDYHMTHGEIRDPHLNGDAFLKNLKDLEILVPIIGVSTDPSEEVIAKMKKLGCTNFIKKMDLFDIDDSNGNQQVFYTILKLAIQNYENEQKILKFLEKEKRDNLTNLRKRDFFYEKFEEIQKTQQIFSVLMIDIDKFKNINDNYGHGIGDLVIKKVASVCEKSIKTDDLAIRWGGEEFVILLTNTDIKNGEIIAERIRSNIEKSIIQIDEKKSISITISIGITQYLNNENSESIVNRADEHLYSAKKTGRNKVVSK